MAWSKGAAREAHAPAAWSVSFALSPTARLLRGRRAVSADISRQSSPPLSSGAGQWEGLEGGSGLGAAGKLWDGLVEGTWFGHFWAGWAARILAVPSGK